MDSWIAIKQLCKARFQVDPTVLDYIAVYDVLELGARGKSNKVIEVMTGFDSEYIQATLEEFYSFSGLSMNIKVDVRSVYQRHKYNKYRFISFIRSADPVEETVLQKLYYANQYLDKIERLIDDYYGNS